MILAMWGEREINPFMLRVPYRSRTYSKTTIVLILLVAFSDKSVF